MRVHSLLVMLLMGVAGAATAQKKDEFHFSNLGRRDNYASFSHVEVDLGQQNALVVQFRTFAELEARQNIDSLLHLFLTDYRKVADSAQAPTNAFHVLFRLDENSRGIDIRTTPPKTTSFRFMDPNPEPLLVKTRQDTLRVVWASRPLPFYDFSVYLMVNNLSDLERILQNGGVNIKLKEAIQAARNYKGHDLTSPKMAFNLRYKHEGSSIQTNFVNPGSARRAFLSFHPSFGVGLIRNTWVPSLNLDVNFIPSRQHNVGYTVGYNSNFFFTPSPTDGRLQVQRTDFLKIGLTFYKLNANGTTNFGRQLAGFYVGIPVHRQGNQFNRNAIQLGGTLYQKGFIKIQPELYMNGFFKQVFPGVRIGLGL